MQGTRDGKLKNGLKFEGIKIYTIFGYNEAQEMVDMNAKHTLQQVEADIILVTLKKNITQIMNVLRSTPGTSSEIFKVGKDNMR